MRVVIVALYLFIISHPAQAADQFIEIEITPQGENAQTYTAQCSREYETCFLTVSLSDQEQIETVMWFWETHAVFLFLYKGEYLYVTAEGEKHKIINLENTKRSAQEIEIYKPPEQEDQPWNRMEPELPNATEVMAKLLIRIR